MLYTSAIEEYHKRVDFKNRIKEDQNALDESGESETLLLEGVRISPEACNQLHALAKDYKTAYFDFYDKLTSQSEVNLKFLSFRLDFNEYYAGARPAHRGEGDVTGKDEFDPLNVDSSDDEEFEDDEEEKDDFEEEDEEEDEEDEEEEEEDERRRRRASLARRKRPKGKGGEPGEEMIRT